MKLISWNIDSLNAALTGDSTRAQLSRAVIDTLVTENADIIAIQETKLSAKGPTKKHLQILEDYFLTMSLLGVHLLNLPVKVMLEPCSCIKRIDTSHHLS